MPFGTLTRCVDTRNRVLDRGEHERHLANTIERPCLAAMRVVAIIAVVTTTAGSWLCWAYFKKLRSQFHDSSQEDVGQPSAYVTSSRVASEDVEGPYTQSLRWPRLATRVHASVCDSCPMYSQTDSPWGSTDATIECSGTSVRWPNICISKTESSHPSPTAPRRVTGQMAMYVLVAIILLELLNSKPMCACS